MDSILLLIIIKQSHLDHHSDFLITQIISLVPILSQILIGHDKDPCLLCYGQSEFL